MTCPIRDNNEINKVINVKSNSYSEYHESI